MDEELFVLCGQQFVHMLMQYDLLRHRNGLLNIMNVDEDKIQLSYLTDCVKELTGAQRGIQCMHAIVNLLKHYRCRMP